MLFAEQLLKSSHTMDMQRWPACTEESVSDSRGVLCHQHMCYQRRLFFHSAFRESQIPGRKWVLALIRRSTLFQNKGRNGDNLFHYLPAFFFLQPCTEGKFAKFSIRAMHRFSYFNRSTSDGTADGGTSSCVQPDTWMG